MHPHACCVLCTLMLGLLTNSTGQEGTQEQPTRQHCCATRHRNQSARGSAAGLLLQEAADDEVGKADGVQIDIVSGTHNAFIAHSALCSAQQATHAGSGLSGKSGEGHVGRRSKVSQDQCVVERAMRVTGRRGLHSNCMVDEDV